METYSLLALGLLAIFSCVSSFSHGVKSPARNMRFGFAIARMSNGDGVSPPGGLPQQVVDFKIKLDSSPDDVFFEETMGIISSNYDYTEKPFKNGELSNAAGENGGSCKVFSLGKLAVLSEQQTLNCFGEHYRDVLADPDGTAHGNIRNFMTKGWNGIEFGEGLGLTLKKK
mmetsp:Transcript_52124/g.76251  ORF Transcript_52124/g.76251 Transcript_52124/m.76251 type:complete len:171 (+) Transcript_52124:77-589(+)